jgi:hypothetical protein
VLDLDETNNPKLNKSAKRSRTSKGSRRAGRKRRVMGAESENDSEGEDDDDDDITEYSRVRVRLRLPTPRPLPRRRHVVLLPAPDARPISSARELGSVSEPGDRKTKAGDIHAELGYLGWD